MELGKTDSFFSKLFLKEAKPFIAKRDVNWKRLSQAAGFALIVLIFALLVMPDPKPANGSFHEKTSGATSQTFQTDSSGDALTQLQQSSASFRSAQLPNGGVGHGDNNKNRNSSMIISRSGSDGKSSLPAGARITVRLVEKAIVSTQPMPVIGIVEAEVLQEDSIAIPKGAKLFGDASFDDNAERAQVSWKTIRLPDGRERPLAAISVANDGQAGVEGKVHSNALKNTAGQTLSRFVGAYADGSMQKGAFGSSSGGSENGFKNAVAETAKDRADALGQDLQKQKKWIEIEAGATFFAVLTSSFQFRDPGASYGR